MESKNHWADKYISHVEDEGEYVVWDQRGEFLFSSNTLTDARNLVIQHCEALKKKK